jgi:Rieske Fe-S protein
VEGNKVYTGGGVVTAKHIVFATHYPFVNAPGYYFLRMHQSRSYLLALEGAKRLDGMYLGVDSGGYTLRNSGGLTLFGGGDHRTGENSAGGQYQRLRSAAEKYFPGCREVASWSAQDCITVDSVPYIGRYSESTPDWYVATGFRKWGMTGSMAAARILSGLICREPPSYAEVFSPQRFVLPASAKTLWEEGKQAAKGLSRRIFTLPKEKAEHLPNGHGGVVEFDGEKVGVYKDELGQIFSVPVKCTHLGCQLEWNPDEKSWDCPCHGSRFDFKGNLIDSPAQEDLTER